MMSYQQFIDFFSQHQGILIIISLWSLFWKGLALWRAGRNNQKYWFVALLVLNTIGILEMIYLFWLSKPASRQTSNNNLG
jgi:hypothetical protein